MKGKIFNAQEVQAILNKSKVMFREVIKPQPRQGLIAKIRRNKQGNIVCMEWSENTDQKLRFTGLGMDICKAPYQEGQKIFCKEKFAEVEVGAGFGYNSGKQTLYRADDDYVVDWKPAQHMKQEHSRLTLLIKEIRVERLGEISEEDCLNEGCYFAESYFSGFGKTIKKVFSFSKDALLKQEGFYDYKKAFSDNWNATHKKPEEKFEANPWVWVILFEN